jgi:hypothetical protein
MTGAYSSSLSSSTMTISGYWLQLDQQDEKKKQLYFQANLINSLLSFSTYKKLKFLEYVA